MHDEKHCTKADGYAVCDGCGNRASWYTRYLNTWLCDRCLKAAKAKVLADKKATEAKALADNPAAEKRARIHAWAIKER